VPRKAHKTKRARKPAKVRKVIRRAPAPPEPAIVVHKLGTAIAIELRRDSDGKSYRHQFSVKASVYRTRDGRQLIVGPVRISPTGTIEG
jgi:hypothetical protein